MLQRKLFPGVLENINLLADAGNRSCISKYYCVLSKSLHTDNAEKNESSEIFCHSDAIKDYQCKQSTLVNDVEYINKRLL